MNSRTMINWINEFSASEWPGNVIDVMAPRLFHMALFPLRIACGFAMWPSAFESAHVRPSGDSRHSTKGGTRLSDATDMHVRTYAQLMRVFMEALAIPAIGGIGLYFDTNTPMFHIDTRPERLVWIRVDGEYIYLNNDPIRFFIELGKALEAKQNA